MDDILERLKAITKINGAYPRDIKDAIKEIELLRKNKQESQKELCQNYGRCNCSSPYCD